MGKAVNVPHFKRDTVEYASRESDESKPGIKKLLPFLKNTTKEGHLMNFQDLIVALDAYYCLHKFNKCIAIRRQSKAQFKLI